MALHESVLEPAIPEHLRTERTLPSRLPPDYHPPFPAYAARFSKSADGVVIAVIGFQSKDRDSRFEDCQKKLVGFMRQQVGDVVPKHWDLSSVIDKRGYHNIAAIAYWATPSDYEAWLAESGFAAFWDDLKPDGDVGWFREAFSPSIDRFENIFSDNEVPEGVAHMRESVSRELQEHVYWGSMRDRLPISQTDLLVGNHDQRSAVDEVTDTRSQRIRVPGRRNLAIIRSGQDWSGTDAHERELYLTTMHPVLIKGMEYLTHQGSETGCFSNRFMEVIDADDASRCMEKTFGLGYFDDIASLEAWSKKHRTHLAIFGRFHQYAKELENNLQLRLFHEVLVLTPEQQDLEYVGCHEDTGMLTAR
ncbi:hypothetical protein WHR41_06552 [Cladosporium halotolerans]|uniref:Phenylacetaldoxime dehydratase n=1 Tax=Cladosporium halotolerans TaxID=1052096 RepID=A0AB34KL50_9PEZI